MVRKSLLLSLCCLSLSAALAQQSAKLSPLTQIYLHRMEQSRGQLPPQYAYRFPGSGQVYVGAMVKTTAALDPEALTALGAHIGTKAGSIWTLQLPATKVKEIAAVPGIAYLQLDEPVYPSLAAAREQTGVDSVHEGLAGLPQAYHGDNVVVGVIDAGFDYRHPSLFDTTGTIYRVDKVWEQVSAGTPPAGYTYGSELSNPADMWADGHDLIGSHGAHVAGIAAGGGYGSSAGKAFRGMAPAASLVLVGIKPPPSDWTTTGMGSIIDGMNYVYTHAAAQGRPAVVNLSWGCSIGPHDGLSLFSQACDALTGPGKLFVCSAGNNGSTRLHVNKTFTATDTAVHSFPGFDPALGEKKTWVDIWGDSSKTFCVQLSLYSGTTRTDSTGWICLDDQLHNLFMTGGSADTLYASLVTSTSEFNGKPRVFIDLHSKVADDVLISIRGTAGTVHMWSGYVKDTRGYYADFSRKNLTWAVNGNTNSTIGDMASTRSAIAVAAYNSTVTYTNVSGGVQDYSMAVNYKGRAPFSSKGPTADGRIKPDIAAPGLVLGSAVSSYDTSYFSTAPGYGSVVHLWTDPNNNKEYAYAMMMGTSMSSPSAAGIVALMLQAAPALTPQQTLDALAATALQDSYTGTIAPGGNNNWGHGKIHAPGAIAAALTATGITTPSAAAPMFRVYPNPAAETFYISFQASAAGSAQLRLSDVQGRTIYAADHTAVNGSNTWNIPVQRLSKGVYLITLTTATGAQMQRVVVQ